MKYIQVEIDKILWNMEVLFLCVEIAIQNIQMIEICNILDEIITI